MIRLLLVDNYDSFTFNLVHAFQELGSEVEVRLNDRIGLEESLSDEYDGIVISPGPGRSEHAGSTPALVKAYCERMPMLGVCLGHQAIAQHFGADVKTASQRVHGKTSWIQHRGDGLYLGLPNPFPATRYHSLAVRAETIREPLVVDSWTEDGTPMGLIHRDCPLFGVQFHPESVLTLCGKRLLGNFLDRAAAYRSLPCLGNDAKKSDASFGTRFPQEVASWR